MILILINLKCCPNPTKSKADYQQFEFKNSLRSNLIICSKGVQREIYHLNIFQLAYLKIYHFFFARTLNLLVIPLGFHTLCNVCVEGKGDSGLPGLFAFFLLPAKARRAPGRISSILLFRRLLDSWSSWTGALAKGAGWAELGNDGWLFPFAFCPPFLLPLTPRLFLRWVSLISQSANLGFLARLVRNKLNSCLFMLSLIWCRMNLEKAKAYSQNNIQCAGTNPRVSCCWRRPWWRPGLRWRRSIYSSSSSSIGTSPMWIAV